MAFGPVFHADRIKMTPLLANPVNTEKIFSTNSSAGSISQDWDKACPNSFQDLSFLSEVVPYPSTTDAKSLGGGSSTYCRYILGFPDWLTY